MLYQKRAGKEQSPSNRPKYTIIQIAQMMTKANIRSSR